MEVMEISRPIMEKMDAFEGTGSSALALKVTLLVPVAGLQTGIPSWISSRSRITLSRRLFKSLYVCSFPFRR